MAASSVGRRATRDTSAWDAIDYAPAPADKLVAPERHWPWIADVPMTPEQRVALNRLAFRFSCEMVAHFERYIVDFLEQHRDRLHGAISDRAAQVFADDERAHVGGFLRLLAALAPAEYASGQLAFFRWSFWDRAVVRLAPAVTFFMAADLLEEMFLHLHYDLEAHRKETLQLAREVMALHAREEKSHLSMDDKILSARSAELPAWQFAVQTLASLLVVIVVERTTNRAWERAVDDRASSLGLLGFQRRALRKKRLSRSDRQGLAAYIERRRRAPLPGTKLLCRVLEFVTR